MADLANSKTVQKWAFVVCAVVILGFLVGILGILLNPKTSAVLQARMAFIFVFFAVACVMGLLFLQSTAKAEAGANVGVWKIAIMGPGAFFLACLILYNQFFHEDVIQLSDPITMKAFSEIIRDTETRSGWSGYGEWQRKIKGLAPEIAQNEEKTMETFLSAVYYRGDDSHKLENPYLQSIWFYGKPDSDGKFDTIKILRITGRWEQDAPRIYAQSKATTMIDQPDSMLFVKHLNSDVIIIVPGNVSSQGAYQPDPNWNDVSDFPADCLLVTKYHERLPGGDYILIDPSKYVTAESRGATIEFSVFSDSPLQEPQLWEMKGAGAVYPGEVPLLFREFKSASQRDTAVTWGRTRYADQGFNKWLQRLDEMADKQANGEEKMAISFLQSARKVIQAVCNEGTASFQASFTGGRSCTFSYRLNKMKNPVIATFSGTTRQP